MSEPMILVGLPELKRFARNNRKTVFNVQSESQCLACQFLLAKKGKKVWFNGNSVFDGEASGRVDNRYAAFTHHASNNERYLTGAQLEHIIRKLMKIDEKDLVDVKPQYSSRSVYENPTIKAIAQRAGQQKRFFPKKVAESLTAV